MLKRAFILSLIFFLTSCADSNRPGPDTCTAGDNMSNPTAAGNFESTLIAPELVINWEAGTQQGANLPESYFEAVSVYSDMEAELKALIHSVSYSGTREITVNFNDLTNYLDTKNTLTLVLAFPDRNQFINCTHPGMQDQYLLYITLTFNSSSHLIGTEFEQIIIFGDI